MDDKELRHLAIEISILSNSRQMKLLYHIFQNLEGVQKERWFRNTAEYAYPKTRWDQIDIWMERRFLKGPLKTPKQVATMCMHYMKMDRRMLPFMIKLSQKIKRRVQMRRKRISDNESTEDRY